MRTIRVIDSHTEGEPTRVVVEGGPPLGAGPLAELRERFRTEHDRYRSAIANEPRGSDVLVGALLTEPHEPQSLAGVIFFNNIGYLGMCGHGTIGVVTTLAHLGRIGPGHHRLDTPVGTVSAELHEDGRVTVTNVPSYRLAAGVSVDVPGHGLVTGDVAWGGNWFFLVKHHAMRIAPDNIDALTDFTFRIARALEESGVRGSDGALVDHVELFTASTGAASEREHPRDGGPVADSRNFVLCPGKAYDRSPCGTGTSAKLACLHADGTLAPGQVWRQESVIGSSFEGSVVVDPERPDRVVPRITGRAHVVSEATLLLDDADPFCWGIRTA